MMYDNYDNGSMIEPTYPTLISEKNPDFEA
jgi:hypothetical protein